MLTCTSEEDEVEDEKVEWKQRVNHMLPSEKSMRVCSITTTKMMTIEKKSQISTSLKYDVLGSELEVW